MPTVGEISPQQQEIMSPRPTTTSLGGIPHMKTQQIADLVGIEEGAISNPNGESM